MNRSKPVKFGTIEVAIRGLFRSALKTEIDALVIGKFAAHPVLPVDQPEGGAMLWCVTHVGCGLSAGKEYTMREAIRVASELNEAGIVSDESTPLNPIVDPEAQWIAEAIRAEAFAS